MWPNPTSSQHPREAPTHNSARSRSDRCDQRPRTQLDYGNLGSGCLFLQEGPKQPLSIKLSGWDRKRASHFRQALSHGAPK